MSLRNLSDERLIANTKIWNEKEEYCTRQFLRHINEVNRRRLFCDSGTGSLFKYIRKNFNKSDSETSRRILAAKTLRHVPIADKALANKQVTLTNLAELSNLVSGIKSNKKKNEILKSIVGKTQTQTRELVDELSGKKRATRPSLTQMVVFEFISLLWGKQRRTMSSLKSSYRIKEFIRRMKSSGMPLVMLQSL
ncbi:MAG: hypothetical protein HOE90_03540 [Bacteriovoracaceae bacterium]|nr:hypothetical protein [Bacteriovoracaceae bacterium]